jgi:hypothetical protein
MKILNLPNLNESVLAALDFFSSNQPPRLNLADFSLPLVVGSGNAYNTGLVLFSQQPAIIANESSFRQIITSYRPLIKRLEITQALIISASGEKDAIWETKLAKKQGLNTTLLTCSPKSSAAKLADQVISYQKLPEPYTYNTSTYLGIILGASQESAKSIEKFLRSLRLPKNFSSYSAYSFILPDDCGQIAPMLEIKRHELFGPYLSLRAFSFGEARHAKFVNNWDQELVVSFGANKYFGLKSNRLQIKLPRRYGPALIMALGYYLIGQIQAAKTPYFKNNIKQFCQTGPLAYDQTKPFPLIVE